MFPSTQNVTAMWRPASAGTAGTVEGWTFNSTGQVSHPALSNNPTSNLQTTSRRTQWQSAAGPNAVGGLVTAHTICWRGNVAAREGGFCFTAKFTLSANPPGTRAFVGVTALNTNICAAEPSAAPDTIGMGFDSTDPSAGHWFLLLNDGANSRKLALDGIGGTGVALRNATDVYDVIIHAQAGTLDLYVRILNASTGAVIHNARLSTASNLPRQDKFLNAQAQAGRGGSNGTGTQFQLLSMDLDSVLDGVYSVRHYGAMGDGVTNDLPAFDAAIAAMSNAPAPGPGGRLFVPSGNYRLTGDLHITREVNMNGTSGGGGSGGSILTFVAGKGIIVDRSTTSPDGGVGDSAVIQNLTLIGANLNLDRWSSGTYAAGARVRPATVTGYHYECVTAGTTGTQEPTWAPGLDIPGTTYQDGSVLWKCSVAAGIYLHARARIDNVYITFFTDSGVHIQADLTYPTPTIASGFRLSQVAIRQCGGHGVLVRGDDANTGLGDAVDVQDCRGYGIWDHSLIGNTWIMPQVNSVGGRGSYRFDGVTQHSIAIGPYAEESDPPSHLRWPSMFIGGYVLKFDDESDGMRLSGTGASTLRVLDRSDKDMPITSWLGTRDGTRTALGLFTPDDHPLGLRWRYDKATGRWPLLWALSPSWQALAITNGRGLPGPGILCVPRLVMGLQGSTERTLTYGTTAPTTGFWTRGDRIYDASPMAGGPEGWVCIPPAGYPAGGWAPAWTMDTAKYAGDVVVPTAANGFIYRMTAYEATFTGYSGQTGAAQPIWPTTLGAEVADNQVIWTCAGVDASGGATLFKTFGEIAT